jgi:inner membrane protein
VEVNIVAFFDRERTAGTKLALAVAMGFLLSIPIFSIYLLNYDRQSQSREARDSITSGWGASQEMSGPVLVIPYRTRASETLVENGRSVTHSSEVKWELTLAPETLELRTKMNPEVRKRSIYEAVIYGAGMIGKARFALPADLAQAGVDPAQMDLAHAELRFGLTDPRGLGANPRLNADGKPLRPQPGEGTGSSSGKGFFAWIDASKLNAGAILIDFAFEVRGNEALSLAPQAGDTRWTVESSWPSPSFGGGFLPTGRKISETGFVAMYRIGNLALGRSLVSTADPAQSAPAPSPDTRASAPGTQSAQISLIQPIDLYSQVNRATKYGFLFIGFTFLALLMFDVIGGVRVSGVEYLLTGAALVLFFVLLLAFAELIGFTPAYVVAASAIAGLITAYCAAVLASWRRAAFIGGLLAVLYGVLYILLSLEAFSLLIGLLLLFIALAAVMYVTRRIDWGGGASGTAEA